METTTPRFYGARPKQTEHSYSYDKENVFKSYYFRYETSILIFLLSGTFVSSVIIKKISLVLFIISGEKIK